MVDQIDRLQEEIIGVHALRAFAASVLEFCLSQIWCKAPYDASSDALLQAEKFGKIPLVAVDPNERGVLDVR